MDIPKIAKRIYSILEGAKDEQKLKRVEALLEAEVGRALLGLLNKPSEVDLIWRAVFTELSCGALEEPSVRLRRKVEPFIEYKSSAYFILGAVEKCYKESMDNRLVERAERLVANKIKKDK